MFLDFCVTSHGIHCYQTITQFSNKHYYDGHVKGSIYFLASGTSCQCRRQANEHESAINILLIIYLENSKNKL